MNIKKQCQHFTVKLVDGKSELTQCTNDATHHEVGQDAEKHNYCAVHTKHFQNSGAKAFVNLQPITV